MKYTVNREKSEVTLSFTASEAEWKRSGKQGVCAEQEQVFRARIP